MVFHLQVIKVDQEVQVEVQEKHQHLMLEQQLNLLNLETLALMDLVIQVVHMVDKDIMHQVEVAQVPQVKMVVDQVVLKV